VAAEQRAEVAIGDGPRRAGAAVPGRVVAVEVGAPHRIVGTQVANGCARRPDDAALARLRHEAVAAAKVIDGRAGRPGPVGMAWAEDRHLRLGPPGRLPWSCVKDRRPHLVRRVAGRRAEPRGASCAALWAVGARAVEPLVPGLAADVIELTALGHGSTVAPIIGEAGVFWSRGDV
jgi:hypothetical protein